MKNKTRRAEAIVDQTERIRSLLFFLMLIETKLINKQIYRIASLDMSEIKNISKRLF